MGAGEEPCGCHNDERSMKRTSRGPFHFQPFAPIFTKRQDGNRTPNLLPEGPHSMQRLNPPNSLLERSIQLLTERTLRVCSVGTVPFRFPMKRASFLPFENGKHPLFKVETVTERNGTVPTEQAFSVFPTHYEITHVGSY